MTIYGDGSQTRSFCYMDDLLEAMIRTMEQDDMLVRLTSGILMNLPFVNLPKLFLKKFNLHQNCSNRLCRQMTLLNESQIFL